MSKAAAILLAAGASRRLEGSHPKQFLELAGKPVLAYSIEALEKARNIEQVVVVVPQSDVDSCRAAHLGGKVMDVVAGGKERQDSVRAGIEVLGTSFALIAIHDAARPLIRPDQIDAVVDAADEHGAAVLGVHITDTVKEVDGAVVVGTLDRSRLTRVQTPQVFWSDLIRRAHQEAEQSGELATDDAGLAERIGHTVRIVQGSEQNLKITTSDDLAIAEELLRKRAGSVETSTRIGQGYDVHALVEGRPLILGGVEVPHDRGLDGHSDADVLSHAVVDAILGAAGEGDIGRHFPDTDDEFKGISSLVLLERAAVVLAEGGASVQNVDATVMAQRPKLAEYIPQMQRNIAKALGIPEQCVSVKATTTEKLGFVGKEEGMAAQAVALVRLEN